MSALNSARSTAPRWVPGTAAHVPSARALPRPALVLAPVRCEPPRDTGGIAVERSWREAPVEDERDAGRILVSRWRDDSGDVREHSRAADPQFAVAAIALRPTAARLMVGGKSVHDGPVPAGFSAITRAGQQCAVQFRGPCDFLHLFVPHRRFAGIAAEVDNGPSDSASGEPWLPMVDPVVERLAWLLLKGGEDEVRSSNLYLEGIALAIVGRLLDRSRTQDPVARGLVKWRLKRVQDFIEAQLSEPLSLADLARCAGLSRMHFAAQFRAATGMRPHDYLVRKRIQRAQEILLTTGMPLVEVALSVGFQTQAHFTTVFRRWLGETPGRWREAQRLG